MKTIHIRAQVHPHGITIIVADTPYSITYPEHIWNAFPKELQIQLAETAAYIYTHHLAVKRNIHMIYNFPPPALRSLFFHGFLYSIAATSIEFPEKHQSTESLIKKLYNSDFHIQFTGLVRPLPNLLRTKMHPKTAVVPFSLGKDSLLTYAILKDLGYTVVPVLFYEPASPHENEQKQKLVSQFEKDFGVKIYKIQNSFGSLRDGTGLMWGWDMLLLQYTVLLVPFIWAYGANFLFWSNEQSVNEVEIDKHGYTLNPTHEQSSQWMLNMNYVLRAFGLDTTTASLIEPMHELMIMYILHQRYPEVAKYQHSCFGDITKPNQRWCGKCYECARVYIYLLAVGVHPRERGFTDNMLGLSKRSLYYLFEKKYHEHLHSLFQSLEEVQLAFMLSNIRNVKGGLMNLYESMYMSDTKSRFNKLLAKYLTVHTFQTIPPRLELPLKIIYASEVAKFCREIKKDQLTPVEKFEVSEVSDPLE